MAKTILVPTDFSGDASAALYYAGQLAIALQADILIIYVKPGNVLPHAVDDVADNEESRIHALLDATRPSDPTVSFTKRFLRGNPADEILKLAAGQVDLVIMGTHGQTNAPDMLLGSIAQAVVRKSTCPVLTVKSPAGNAG